MQTRILMLFIFIGCFGCKKTETEKEAIPQQTETAFNSTQWKTKEGADYPYRENMLTNLVSSDTLKTLNKAGILNLLGEPTRSENNHLFYLITQKRLGPWPLTTKTLVIKLKKDNTVEWVKIHQ